MFVVCCVGTDLCNGPIHCPGESYLVCMSFSVISCNKNHPPLQRVGRRGQTKKMFLFLHVVTKKERPGSSVDIETAYGLDGLGIESRWGQDVRHLSRSALRTTQSPVQWVPDLFRGKCAGGAGRDADLSPPSSA